MIIKHKINVKSKNDFTYCLFNNVSFCRGRDWHERRHWSKSLIASFWLKLAILLVDGRPNLARRRLASTDRTAAKIRTIFKAKMIFMTIRSKIIQVCCLIMKILRRTVTFKAWNRSFKHAMELSKNLRWNYISCWKLLRYTKHDYANAGFSVFHFLCLQ